jgi:acetylornithine deacetylase/succinyl-diaminopimelate desuccinylase-like protein
LYSFLREKAEKHFQDLIGFTAELVSIPSPSFCEAELADKVEKKMQALGYDNVLRDGIGNVAGIIYGRDYGPTLLLISHMDTSLDLGKESLKSRLDEDRIYGIGASDCKSGLAAQMFAGKLLSENLPLKGNLIVAATVAEHNGCSIGTKYFVKNTLTASGLQPSFAILGEPTNLGLYYGHDGWLSICVKFRNWNHEMLNRTCEEFRDFLGKNKKTSAQKEEISTDLPLYNTENGTAEIKTVHRLRAENEILHILRRIRNAARLICRQYKSSVTVSISRMRYKIGQRDFSARQISFPWQTDPFNPFFENAHIALRAAQCTLHGGMFALEKLGMGTAGRSISEGLGIPVIGYGPGNEEITHDPDEYVEIANINEAFFGTAVIAHRIIGETSAGIY